MDKQDKEVIGYTAGKGSDRKAPLLTLDIYCIYQLCSQLLCIMYLSSKLLIRKSDLECVNGVFIYGTLVLLIQSPKLSLEAIFHNAALIWLP